jgi:phosphohistidine phosphatase
LKLVLFRHGLAMEREDWQATSQDDSLRPLVSKGKIKSQQMAVKIQKLLKEVDMVVTSPYVRARQTAEVFKPVFKIKRLVESVELVPSAPPSAFCNWLKVHAAHKQNVIAVGHEPHLSQLATWLLSGQTESFLRLKKSGFIILEVESFVDLGPRGAQLHYLLQPKL